jgi:hypothetical protein
VLEPTARPRLEHAAFALTIRHFKLPEALSAALTTPQLVSPRTLLFAIDSQIRLFPAYETHEVIQWYIKPSEEIMRDMRHQSLSRLPTSSTTPYHACVAVLRLNPNLGRPAADLGSLPWYDRVVWEGRNRVEFQFILLFNSTLSRYHQHVKKEISLS